MYFVNLTLGCPKMFMCVLKWKHLSSLVFVQFWCNTAQLNLYLWIHLDLCFS